MANIKITDLSAYSDPKSTDVLPIVDVTNDATKKVSIADLMENAGAGAEATPGIAFDGDPNTGIYSPGADQLAISTGGTQRILISDTGVVTIAGDLTVNGTTTTIDTTTLIVEDKNIEMGAVATPSDTTADGGGITLKGATDKTLNWVNATDSWTSSENVDLASGKTYKIAGTDVLSATALGSAVQISSANIPSGTIVNDDVNASAAIAGTKIDPDFGSQTVETTGVFSAAGGAQGTPSITFTGDLNTGIYSPGADQVAISTGGTGRLFVDASGRVSIGDSSPNFPLCVVGTTTSGIGIRSSAGAARGFELWNNSTSDLAYISNYYNGPIIFQTNNTERLRIDSSGRLLVGTSSSTGSKFVVQGNIGANVGVIDIASNLQADSGGLTNTEIGAIRFTDTNANRFGLILCQADGATAVSDFPGRLTFHTTADGDSTPAERMRISANGNVTVDTNTFFVDAVNNRVGIGTTSPGTRLTIGQTSDAEDVNILRIYRGGSVNQYAEFSGQGGGAIINSQNGSGGAIVFRGDGNERARIDSSGRVGIGTSSPQANLHVVGASGGAGEIYVSDVDVSSAGSSSLLLSQSGNSSFIYNRNTSGQLRLGAGGASDNIVIATSGNVGVGTTSPDSKVEIRAATDTTEEVFKITNSSDNNNIVVRQEGSSGYAIRSSLDLRFDADYDNDTSPAGSNILFRTDGTEKARISADGLFTLGDGTTNAVSLDPGTTGRPLVRDSSGRLLVGTATDTAPGGYGSAIQAAGSNTSEGSISLRVDTGSSAAPFLLFGKGRGTPGARAIVQDQDVLGEIRMYGALGASAEAVGARITANVTNNTVGASSLPTDLKFWTTPSGSTTPQARMTIKEDGKVGIATSSPRSRFELGAGHIVLPASGRIGTGGSGDTPETAFRFTSADNITAIVGNSEKLRIDNSGRLLVGTSSSRSAAGLASEIAVETQQGFPSMAIIANTTTAGQEPRFVFGRSKGSTKGSSTVVADGDSLGHIQFAGADGTDLNSIAASIRAYVDGTPGANDMPGRLVFSTTADGASSPTERMRIDKNGRLTVQYGGAVLREHTRADNANQIAHNVASTDVLWLNITTTSYAAAAHRVNCYRTNTSAFSFAQFTSGNLGDDEFIFRGDGNGLADGSFSGGGADYAEYFEWSDGNTTAEDRRGISVVLDGDKIREAVAGEEPIGVISGNPSVVGDAAWNKWNGKYLRDDFGTYIRNAEGERQLNPDYDPDVEYVSRENRPEWDCVGLMGKLRIRKGQVTGARWIKMRDISDTVEEWLVR